MVAEVVQGSFDELGTPLRETAFVVVDLETTGGSPHANAITEIGAVRVRGGEVEGTFHTLVNPGAPIPPFITILTGITDTLVAPAPPIDAVLPAFLEFSRGAVLVAHNAPFDLGFLRANAERLGHTWPAYDHLDTARLARRVLTRDEAPDCRLATLARVLRATVQPTHRALDDARATVDVLHALIERLGNLGVHSVDELRTFSALVSPQQRRKRHLADPLPHAPGVYLFRDAQGRTLYVGKSRDLRSRVRTYFVASEPRTRMAEMVGLAERVDHIVCAHSLEAEVRELRLIAEHKPRYNRRSKFPERTVYVKLTPERFPRLSVVRRVHDDGGVYLGPCGSRMTAELLVAAIHEAVPLRQCTMRITGRTHVAPCLLYEMGRCGAPCAGKEDVESYALHAGAVADAMTRDAAVVVAPLRGRMESLARAGRFEDAALVRDRLAAFVRVASRAQSCTALTSIDELVAAKPDGRGGWDLACVRHGRLAGAAHVRAGLDPRPDIDALVATSERAPGGVTAEEMAAVLRWLDAPGVRLARLDGVWSSPARGAGGYVDWLESAGNPNRVAPFADRRGLRPPAPPGPRRLTQIS